jgi:phosphodiester glycosidase
VKPVHPTIRLSVSLAAAALLVLAIGPAQDADAGRAGRSGPGARAPIVKTRRIAPGLTYMRIVRRQLPLRTFVLRIDLSKAITLDTTIAEDALPSRRQLSRIVRNHGALAGVNGDPGEGLGNTVHPFAQDGDLLHTAGPDAEMFAVSKDESSTFLGNPKLNVNVTDMSNGRVFTLDRWNRRAPEPGEIVGFSPLGGTLAAPPSFSCSVRLAPQGPAQVAVPDGVDRDYLVDLATCSESPLDRNGGVVLSTAPGTDEAEQLLALTPGTPMRLHWTLGWPGVFDAVGGDPILLLDGAQTPICVSCARQPRTAIGVTATGRILLVVIDGRQPRWSRGATLGELRSTLRDLGAVDALNLDGGGSSEMVVKGEVVNRPSDGRERRITNAVLILPGADPGE